MQEHSFIPVSEQIDLVDYTPNPDGPPMPELHKFPPFEERPDIEFLDELKFFKRCRLNLKQGCYQITMTPTFNISFLSTVYKGTMRVENGSDHTTISGDLYRIRPLLEVASSKALSIGDAGDTAPIIPIYPRNRYYAYLKVTKIEKPFFVLNRGLCKITLTVEEYRYTHPSVGVATGSFPQAPDRILQIVLEKASNPSGYSGPSFTGRVYHNGKLLSLDFSMLWVSDFYRRARVEVESVTGAAVPVNVGTTDFRSIYATAGWDLTVATGNTNLPVPAGTASSSNPWSNAELHAFMLNNRNPTTNLDKEWQFYYVAVPFDSGESSGLFGIMFDQLDDHREGACNFIDNFDGGNFDDNRSRLRSAAHEIGHGFNQLHPSTEGLTNDNSIMSQSGATRTAILNSGGTYPDDINFAFNEHNRHHLIHSPDVVVRPGGEDFEFGHSAGFAPEAIDNADAAGLEIRINPDNDRLSLGEPLVLNVQLVSNGTGTVFVPKRIGTAFHNIEIQIAKEGQEPRLYHSFVMACDSEELIELKSKGTITSVETLYWDTRGLLFSSPGLYNLSISLFWFDGRIPYKVEATVQVWVNFPISKEENEVAALLLNNEVGKYVALGGNAVHLKEAVSRIERAKKVGRNHAAVNRIVAIDRRVPDRKTVEKPKRKR